MSKAASLVPRAIFRYFKIGIMEIKGISILKYVILWGLKVSVIVSSTRGVSKRILNGCLFLLFHFFRASSRSGISIIASSVL